MEQIQIRDPGCRMPDPQHWIKVNHWSRKEKINLFQKFAPLLLICKLVFFSHNFKETEMPDIFFSFHLVWDENR
jgi:hypothetical protein